MADTQVVRALRIKRAESGGVLDRLQGQLRAAMIHIDYATLPPTAERGWP